MNVLDIGREVVLLVQGQEVVGVGSPLIVVMVGGTVMPLALRGGLAAVGNCPDEVDDPRWTKTLESTINLGCPVWFVIWTEHLFSAAATSSNHTFSSFRRSLKFLRTVFKYGLWCMVFREEAMDQS